MAVPMEISVQELKAWKDEGKDFVLIDVREPSEFKTANMGGTLMPLSTLPARMPELDPEKTIVVHCHHGGRSAMAVQFLRKNGFNGATNLQGGINAWSRQIDPSVPTY